MTGGRPLLWRAATHVNTVHTLAKAMLLLSYPLAGCPDTSSALASLLYNEVSQFVPVGGFLLSLNHSFRPLEISLHP
jgi:hypothetical protein